MRQPRQLSAGAGAGRAPGRVSKHPRRHHRPLDGSGQRGGEPPAAAGARVRQPAAAPGQIAGHG